MESAATKEDQSAPRPRSRWVMLALMWLVYFAFGIAHISIAPLVDPISDDLDISDTQMGIILGAWQLGYVFMAYVLGTLIDRIGIRRSLGIGIVLITLSLVLRSVAVDFFSLLAIVSILGIGGPLISIGAPKLVAVWFSAKERGLAAGIYSTAPSMGTIATLWATNSLVVPLVGSWRGSFVIYGLIVAAIAVTWWLLARDHPDDTSSQGEPRRSNESAPSLFKELMRVYNVQLILFLSLGSFLLSHSLGNWLPTFLTDEGLSASRAGFFAGLPLVAGLFSLMFIPSISRPGHRKQVIAVLFLLSAMSTLGLAVIGGGLASPAVLLLSGLARSPIMTMLILVLMETPEVGARRTGAAGGLLFSTGEIGGFVGPLLMGVARDMTNSLTTGMYVLAGITGVMTLFPLLLRETLIPREAPTDVG